MAWSYNKKSERKQQDAWSIEAPSSKKRKVETEAMEGDDWGDDSLELTQAEIESMDVIASQVLSEPQRPDQSPSVGSFVRPSNPVHHPLSHRASSSASSSDSSLRPKLSLSSDSSSNSLSSHSSYSNGSHSSLHSKHDGSHSSLLSKHDGTQLESVRELETELEKKDKEVQNAQDEKYRSDGEVKFLRQTLQKKEAEIEQMRIQKNAADDQWRQRQAEKEKMLRLQVDKLISESHFKEREHQERIQMMERKLKEKEVKQKANTPESSTTTLSSRESRESKPSSPMKKAVKPSPPSKQKQLKGDDPLSGSQLPEFPTQSSFMERPQGQSPKARTSLVLGKTKSVSCQEQASAETSEKGHHPKRRKMRRLQLTKASNGDPAWGWQIVSEMMRPCGSFAKEGEPGLPGLLQALSTSLALESLSYCRNKDNSFLSPLKPQRRSLLVGSVPSVSGGETTSSGSNNLVHVVSPDNFHLAIQGLDMLLHSTRIAGNEAQTFPSRTSSSFSPKSIIVSKASSSSPSKKGNSSSKIITTSTCGNSCVTAAPNIYTTTSTTTTASSSSSSSSSPPTSCDQEHPHFGAVLLLPMLCDYLNHYQQHTKPKGGNLTTKSPSTTPVISNNNINNNNNVSRHLHHHPAGGLMTRSGFDSSMSLYAASSGSYDSSLDSLSSSVRQLLQEGKMYAMTMEKYAISAAQCLSLLIQLCPVTTSVLAHPSLTAQSIKISAGVSPADGKQQAVGTGSTKKEFESGTDADDEKSTSSSEIRIIAGFNNNNMAVIPSRPPASLQNQSRLLLCVSRLAAENLEESSASPLVVEESLRVLNHLCLNCSPEEFTRLECVIMKDALSLSLRQVKHPQILLEAQRLCGALIHHTGGMEKMCTKSENCPLYSMYRLCADPQVDNLHAVSTQIYSQHVTILSSIISQHRTGLSGLLVNSCGCSDELVLSTILSMYKLFKTYKKQQPPPPPASPPLESPPPPLSSSSSSSLLYLLLQGILVLHCLGQTAGGAFCQRRSPVQLAYVRLLSGLSALIKPIRAKWEWHATFLDELCDFEPAFQESSSQDSESDDRMDQS